MAAAAVAARPLLHRAAVLPSLSAATPKPHHHQITPQPLRTKSSLKISVLSPPPPPLHSRRRPLRFASAAPYTETDDEEEYIESDDYQDEEDEQQQKPRSPEPVESRRLYVGNLPFTMTPAQLSEIFSQAGAIEGLEIVYDRITDRSRGFGFVTMGSSGEAEEAIRMFNGAQVGGRTAKVNFPEVPRGGEREVVGPRTRCGSGLDSPYKVYAGNLSWAVTSQSLRETFADQPGLIGARVVYNRESGLSRGFGFVSFASPEDAQAAVDAKNEKELEGRPLRLSIAVGRSSTPSYQGSEADQSSEKLDQLSAVES